MFWRMEVWTYGFCSPSGTVTGKRVRLCQTESWKKSGLLIGGDQVIHLHKLKTSRSTSSHLRTDSSCTQVSGKMRVTHYNGETPATMEALLWEERTTAGGVDLSGPCCWDYNTCFEDTSLWLPSSMRKILRNIDTEKVFVHLLKTWQRQMNMDLDLAAKCRGLFLTCFCSSSLSRDG